MCPFLQVPWIGLWSVIVAIKYLCSLARNRLLFKDNNSVFLNLQTITQSFMYLQTTDRKSSVRKPICDIVFCPFDFGVLTIYFCVL